MITTIREGEYELVETHGQVKILHLDSEVFAWISVEAIGELLVSSHREHKTDHILARGHYYLFDVEDEPELTDLNHLELSVGNNTWQGYLLPRGLPFDGKTRSRIIPTTEVITQA